MAIKANGKHNPSRFVKEVRVKLNRVRGSCVWASVSNERDEIVHTTRDFPYGQDSNAYASASAWAEANGYEVA